MHGTRLGTIAVVGSIAALMAFAACGDADNSSPTSSSATSPTPTASAEPSRTAEPTASPLGADSADVQHTLGWPGFKDFLRQFANAVGDNDTQFFIDNAYFLTPDCPSPGVTPAASPRFCLGLPQPPTSPAIFMGGWNSEGATVTAKQYEETIRDSLSADSVPAAAVYALGEQKHELGLGESEVGIIVVRPGALSSPLSPGDESVFAFRVDRIEGEWRIVGMDGGLVSLVPYFFEWYAPWDVVAPELG